MGLTSAQAKGRIKNIASKNGADPRVLMRICMMGWGSPKRGQAGER